MSRFHCAISGSRECTLCGRALGQKRVFEEPLSMFTCEQTDKVFFKIHKRLHTALIVAKISVEPTRRRVLEWLRLCQSYRTRYSSSIPYRKIAPSRLKPLCEYQSNSIQICIHPTKLPYKSRPIRLGHTSLSSIRLISRPLVPEVVFQRNREALLKREFNCYVIHTHACVDSVGTRMVQGRLLDSLRVIIIPTLCCHESLERFQPVPNRFLKHGRVFKARVFVATVLLTLFLDLSHNLVHGVFVDIEKPIIWKVNDQNLHQVIGF